MSNDDPTPAAKHVKEARKTIKKAQREFEPTEDTQDDQLAVVESVFEDYKSSLAEFALNLEVLEAEGVGSDE